MLSQANYIRTRVLALPAMESPEDAAVLRKSHLSKLVATFQEYVSAFLDYFIFSRLSSHKPFIVSRLVESGRTRSQQGRYSRPQCHAFSLRAHSQGFLWATFLSPGVSPHLGYD